MKYNITRSKIISSKIVIVGEVDLLFAGSRRSALRAAERTITLNQMERDQVRRNWSLIIPASIATSRPMDRRPCGTPGNKVKQTDGLASLPPFPISPRSRYLSIFSIHLSQLLSRFAKRVTRFIMARLGRNGFLAIAAVFHLVYVYSIFDIYFVSPIVRGMQEVKVPGDRAPSKRLVLFVGQ
jgi:phosphatidylinositol glycan class N